MPIQIKEPFTKGRLVDRVATDLTRRFAEGRICEAPRCETQLSVYNPSNLCWQHEGAHPYYLRVTHRRGEVDDELRAAG